MRALPRSLQNWLTGDVVPNPRMKVIKDEETVGPLAIDKLLMHSKGNKPDDCDSFSRV
jgi:hypothetical protein